MKFGTGLAYGFVVLVIISLLLSGCDRLQKGADSGFAEMATSVMQQASTQGLQIDPASREALALLIRVYLVRGDLHRAFGEPEKLNLSALVQWEQALLSQLITTRISLHLMQRLFLLWRARWVIDRWFTWRYSRQ